MKKGEKKVSSFDYSNYVIVHKKRDRGTKGTYIPTPTKIMDSLKDYTPVKKDLEYNKYGSYRENVVLYRIAEGIDDRVLYISHRSNKYCSNAMRELINIAQKLYC